MISAKPMIAFRGVLKFVAHIGQKFGLGAVRHLGPIFALPQGVFVTGPFRNTDHDAAEPGRLTGIEDREFAQGENSVRAGGTGDDHIVGDHFHAFENFSVPLGISFRPLGGIQIVGVFAVHLPPIDAEPFLELFVDQQIAGVQVL